MSVSSNSRKESNESNAQKQMRSTMGIHPELAQLNDKNLENDLPSRVADVNSINVSEDVTEIKDTIAENDDANGGMSNRDIEESKRASWGQPPLPADAEDASTDEDSPMTAYRQSGNDMPPAMSDQASNADWNPITEEGAVSATRSNEPDRTLGNS